MRYCDSGDISEIRALSLEQYTVLTPHEVMEILHIGKNSVYTLLNSGQLRGTRVGRVWRIPISAIDEFIFQSDM